MRASQSVSIRPVLEQAINAINDTFERERQSSEIAAEFEAEFNRRMEMPEGTAPKTELERYSAKQYEQDVRFPCYKQVKQGEQGELVEQVPTFGPSIESFYPWSHRATLAADSLAKCRWTTEAEAIDDELRKLPKHPIDWTQPGVFDELREEIQEVGNRVRDILMSCVAEMESQASKSEESVELPFGYVPNVLPKVVEWAKDIGECRRLECKDQLSNDEKAFMRTVKQRFYDNPEQQAAAVEHWECHLSKQSDSSAQ